MDKIINDIKIDIVDQQEITVVRAYQREKNVRELHITLLNNSQIYVPPIKSSIHLEGKKPNGKSYTKECVLQDNIIKVTLDDNITYAPGSIKSRIVIYEDNNIGEDSSKVLSSPIFIISVEEDPYDAESEFSETSAYDSLIQEIDKRLEGAMSPRATITFAELNSQKKVNGYMYNIKDDFYSTEEFVDGGGHYYSAGTNVYYTSSGLWDCLAGAYPSEETIDIDFDKEW